MADMQAVEAAYTAQVNTLTQPRGLKRRELARDPCCQGLKSASFLRISHASRRPICYPVCMPPGD